MSQRAIADALTMMANAMAQEATNRNAERVAQENLRGNEDEARLERFLKNNPQVFKGEHDPDGAIKWLEAMERIFGAMRCSETQKVTLGTYMCWNKRGSDMTQLSFDDNKSINVQ
ncbi:hypothetical protein QL285_014051 [Trifolium repens]|nr:hypothetical protein QL285_014051 [Trifolium repens]